MLRALIIAVTVARAQAARTSVASLPAPAVTDATDHPAARSLAQQQCREALVQACAGKRGPSCDLCAAENQHALRVAGCSARDVKAFCAAVPPSSSGRPPFSWRTLPVFFHSSNASGPWSPAAAKAIAKYAMATNEKSHAMLLPDGSRQSEEIAGPAACRQIAKQGTGTATFFYLNSVIDWPFNYKLHGDMVANPAWREKNASGGDITNLPGGNYMYHRSSAVKLYTMTMLPYALQINICERGRDIDSTEQVRPGGCRDESCLDRYLRERGARWLQRLLHRPGQP